MSFEPFKIKINEEEKTLTFRNPNQEELLALDMEYRRIFSKCLREGIISEAEARKIAEKNGVWTKDDDKKISQIAFQINILESVVNSTDQKITNEQKEEAITKISEQRSEFISLINRKVDVGSHSAENLANQQKMHKFIQLCCINQDGTRFFEDISYYEKFIKDHSDILSEIYKQAHFYEYGNPEKMTDDWAEIKWIKNKMQEKPEQQAEVVEEVKTENVKPKKAKKEKIK